MTVSIKLRPLKSHRRYTKRTTKKTDGETVY